MDFIAGSSTLSCAKELLTREPDEIAVAVAFWGDDAQERLDIPNWSARQVRILCNATTGGCNPKALQVLMKRFGSKLKTNHRLHAKVYWTATKVLITSANASGSGLAFHGKESESNLEAGVASTSPPLINAIKEWFEGIYRSSDSVVVDKGILDLSKRLWAVRPGPSKMFSLRDALRNRELISGRNIWVLNYEWSPRIRDEIKRHDELQRNWRSKRELPPEAINADIHFTHIDDYVEPEKTDLKKYRWRSWVVDLTDSRPLFWFVPSEKRKMKNRASYTVPLYGTKAISFGGPGGISIKADDVKLLRAKWREIQGKKNYNWVPLEDFAIEA